MELGGSDAVVILDDANVDIATTLTVNSRLRNGGQTCTAGKRFIIDEKIYDEFIEKLIPKVKAFKIGSPYEKDTQLGPLSGKQIVKTLEEQIQKGIEQGGKVILEGGPAKEDTLSKGFYFYPTIIEVDENNVLFKEETFGPAFAVIRAKSFEHALHLANNSQYGLGAVILGEDRARAEKFASRVEAGYVSINKPVSSDSRLPSGGVKNSGFGRECGEWGLYEFANIKAVWLE
jgi:succinate-semialdehyde dehydrogenase/glutarate-semialdehyde dehydrogenase